MTEKLVASYDSVIVQPFVEDEKKYGNIIVPTTGEEKNKIGIIKSIGPGSVTITGAFVPTTHKIGDKVILPTMGFTKFEFEGEEYWIGNEKQILGKIEKI